MKNLPELSMTLGDFSMSATLTKNADGRIIHKETENGSKKGGIVMARPKRTMAAAAKAVEVKEEVKEVVRRRRRLLRPRLRRKPQIRPR